MFTQNTNQSWIFDSESALDINCSARCCSFWCFKTVCHEHMGIVSMYPKLFIKVKPKRCARMFCLTITKLFNALLNTKMNILIRLFIIILSMNSCNFCTFVAFRNWVGICLHFLVYNFKPRFGCTAVLIYKKSHYHIQLETTKNWVKSHSHVRVL